MDGKGWHELNDPQAKIKDLSGNCTLIDRNLEIRKVALQPGLFHALETSPSSVSRIDLRMSSFNGLSSFKRMYFFRFAPIGTNEMKSISASPQIGLLGHAHRPLRY
jgi:hypothetical protein